jgi:hypothetical protein
MNHEVLYLARSMQDEKYFAQIASLLSNLFEENKGDGTQPARLVPARRFLEFHFDCLT